MLGVEGDLGQLGLLDHLLLTQCVMLVLCQVIHMHLHNMVDRLSTPVSDYIKLNHAGQKKLRLRSDELLLQCTSWQMFLKQPNGLNLAENFITISALTLNWSLTGRAAARCCCRAAWSQVMSA